MKKLYILMLLLASLTLVMASQETLLDTHQNEIELLSNDFSGIEINYELGDIQSQIISTKGGDFVEISANDYSLTGQEGLPKLPYSLKIISVPVGASVETNIRIKSQSTINLMNRGISYKVIPAQPSVEKCVDKKDVPFVINNDYYNTNQRLNQNPVTVKEIGYMRGNRLFEVAFYPVSYNPVTNDINVINSADVEISFVGGDYSATEELKAKTSSFMFEGIAAKSVFNYTNNTRTSLENYPLGYVIVTPSNFLDTLEPFINWKKEQGYDVTIATTETIGSTTTSIKNYMQGLWDAATAENPAPSYLLIVGDTQQVPAFTGSTDSGHVTDLNYVRLQGTDYLPEMYYGRFSATSVSQLEPQVNKTLMYEKYEFSDPSYLERATLIAGVDGSWAPTHGNGTLYYGSQNYFNSAHGFDATTYEYPASGSSASAIISDVNAGLGFLNYTAHGSETTWHDPQMTISNINSFSNDEMYPVVVGNCCLTNHFNTATCFGEAWLRASNGAVIYIGGTNSTYWDEDYWWSVGHFTPTSTSTPSFASTGHGTYDGLFHEHGEAFEDWAHTAGGMIVTGNMTVQGSSSTRKNYYWEIYSIMGDPSLMPYMGQPDAQTPDYQASLLVGMDSFDITAAPYTYAALSIDGELLGTCLTDANGAGTINFEAISMPGNAKLVLSHTDYQPYITTVEVIPAEGPYLVIESQNATGDMAAGQNISLNLNVMNVGVESVSNVDLVVTALQNAEITNGSATIASVDADESVAVDTAIEFALVNGLEENAPVTLHVVMTAGDDTWEYDLNYAAVAPRLQIADISIDDNDNSLLDPGDVADITVDFTNLGSYVANDLVATLATSTPGVTITQNDINFESVATGATAQAVFTIQVSDYVAVGSVADFEIDFASANEVSNNDEFTSSIGLVFEDFESGDFSSFDYATTSWTVVNDESHEGTYSAKSNTISDNQNTSLTLSMNNVAQGEITFWVKVSSEANYDELTFYIDGAAQDSWSGTVAWQEVSYDVSAGNHTFKWTYDKDYSMSSGSDCAWIDYIVFPSGGGNAGTPEITIDTYNHDFGNCASVTTVDITLGNTGETILAGQITGTEIFKVGLADEEPATMMNYSIDPNQELTFTVYFTPVQNISYAEAITITSNDPANDEIFVNVNGVGEGVNTADNNVLPVVTKLQGNFPNPFNPETTVKYAVKESGKIKLKIFNIKGQLVKTLVNQEVKAGYHSIVWDGTDNFGTDVATGIYMYRLETKTYNQTKKMMLMK